METIVSTEQPALRRKHDPWNKGHLIGQKRPLKPKDVWTIRVRLQLEEHKRDLAMFNLAIDSKLRGCDLVRLKIDTCASGRVRDRATVIQKKTGRPVQFGITEQTRIAIGEWLVALSARRGQIFVPKPFPRAAAPVDSPVRPHRPSVGGARRPRLRRLRIFGQRDKLEAERSKGA